MINRNTINEIYIWLKNNVGVYSQDNYTVESYNMEELFTVTNNGVIECLNLNDYLQFIYLEETVTNIPYKFGRVNCNFICDNSSLKTLQNCPIEVSKSFSCQSLKDLISLEGAPRIVREDFSCYNCCQLTSLEGAPKYILGSFDCVLCDNLVSLKGAPKYVRGNFDCNRCEKLKSLEYSPLYVGGNFDCRYCDNLVSLKGISKYINGICENTYTLNPASN